MLSHEKVVEAVEDYFRNLDIGGKNKQIQREEPITFGARVGGLADVVLQWALRSGYWNNPPVFVRVADRYKRYPGSTHRGAGFRCVIGSRTH